MKKINIMIIFLLIVFLVLIFQSSFEKILRIQGYVNVSLVATSLWLLVILVGIKLIYSDVGFIKIGAILGLCLAIYMFIFLFSYKPYTYDLVSSDQHEVVIEIDDSKAYRVIHIYSRENILFSEKIFEIPTQDNYDLEYEIIDDNLIFKRCTSISCIETIIPLQ
ncbi:MAG: hypothetical protein K9L64_02745 [Candidatus Izimaplasma sp.]|nr:hypothetical protein [Candidatus Izimaplasma bacterium]